MKSIKEIYRIGTGPSSSHTMGPRQAAAEFLDRAPGGTTRYEVVLYGSLAATGKGHMTDVAIIDTFREAGKEVEIIWQPDIFLPYHPNAMLFKALDPEGKTLFEMTVYSVGGGAIKIEGDADIESEDIYPMNKMTDILEYCERSGKCATIEVYRRVYDAVNNVVDNTTLQDLLEIEQEKVANNYVI